MKNKFLLGYSFLICSIIFGFGSIDLDFFSAFNTRGEGDSQKVYALKLPENIDFSDERTPLEAPDIKERLDKELLVNTYWQSNMLLMIKRANKWFPKIESILKEEGIPEDFKYLAVIESGLENVRSPKGAKGFWQLMPSTAKEYGLEVNSNVDERYHIEKSTKVAAEYLINSKERFGSWTLAAAAYNAGNYGIAKRLETQKVSNYYDALLPDETERYVFRIIALKEIINHPKRYGFIIEDKDLYTLPETYTIKVDTAISNITNFAKRYGLTYKEFKIHNPWLRENKLNNKSRKLYEIKIPIQK